MRTWLALPLSLFAVACASERGPLTNRMAQSTTRYLARAARQPVSWQPWGREAFALAGRLDRPVLLYIGADECRWCTQMDREVYIDPALGALIDSFFVPVRVDRDERPDVAEHYQAAVQALAGLHGYPLTVLLTPDGAAFFGGTYFPADDPVTGRGLKQILPEIARSYRDQRPFIVQHAALVRQLALGKTGLAHGVLQPQALRLEVGNVRAALEVLLQARQGLGAFTHTQAVGLLLAEFARTGDSASLAVARAALDVMLDSGAVAAALDDPLALVRAGLARDLAVAWVLTAQPRYREAAGRELHALARGLDAAGADDRPLFADREAYVIGSMLEAAGAIADSLVQNRGVAALDTLLRRVYARGFGVRHAATEGGGGAGVHGLLQDQVQVAAACLTAYAVTGRAGYLEVAQSLAAVLDRDFADPLGGYFDAASGDPPAAALVDRTKPVLDDLLPGANPWVARVFLQLAAFTGDARYRRRAQATLEAFAGAIGGDGLRAASYLAVARDAAPR
ncbi:MAG: hypothetical protein AUH42_01155 [Gemmatimonadetes bacterium 13_1_40CM_70_11]|nr:MAG: hypothetical protein AUH42_01155 [Gemmatimonadetes bacterium 13_1_40CM_70_11]